MRALFLAIALFSIPKADASISEVELYRLESLHPTRSDAFLLTKYGSTYFVAIKRGQRTVNFKAVTAARYSKLEATFAKFVTQADVRGCLRPIVLSVKGVPTTLCFETLSVHKRRDLLALQKFYLDYLSEAKAR